jgi:hypothetical protein
VSTILISPREKLMRFSNNLLAGTGIVLAVIAGPAGPQGTSQTVEVVRV